MTSYLTPLELGKQYSESSRPLLKFNQMKDKNEPNDTTETEASLSRKQQERYACFKKVRGLLFMLLCVICMDFSRFLVKYAYQHNEDLSAIQQGFGKFVGMNILVVLLAISVCKLREAVSSIPRFLWCRFLTRCLVFTSVSLLQAFGIKMLTYSTSVILSFIAPLLAPFTALLILRERITLCNVISLLICFGGVVIFTNPSLFGETKPVSEGQDNSLLGIILTLGSAVCRAVDITLMKLLNNAHAKESQEKYDDHHYIIRVTDSEFQQHADLIYAIDQTSLNQFSVLYYLSLTGSVIGALCFGVEEVVATSPDKVGLFQGETILFILGASVLLLISQLLYSLATKYEDVGKLASVFYFQIVLAFMWEAFVFKGTIGIAEILGTIIILVTSLTVALMKFIK